MPKKQATASGSVANVAFSSTKIFEKAFDALGGAETGTVDASHLQSFFERIGVPVEGDEWAEIKQHVEHENGKKGSSAMTFDEILSILANPQWPFHLEIADSMTKQRKEMVNGYIKAIVDEPDDAKRDKIVRSPPTAILGDKQGCRLLGKEMQKQEHSEMLRVSLAIAIQMIGEKPRLISGTESFDGEKEIKIYDTKSLACHMHTIRLTSASKFLDTRSFWNPEAKLGDPSEDIGLIHAFLEWRKASTEKRRTPEFYDEIPQGARFKKDYFLEFKWPKNEPSDAVRVAALQGVAAVSDYQHEGVMKVLLHTALHDPGFTVRAEALDQIKEMAKEIRKEGFFKRLGDPDRWYDEKQYPWLLKEESRKNFWDVLDRCSRDPAWQVRRRAIQTVSEATDFGNVRAYLIIADRVQDACEIVRRTAVRTLQNTVFGRGLFSTERAHLINVYRTDGIPAHEASVLADREAAKTKTLDMDRAAADALIIKTGDENYMSRRSALQALGEVMNGARVRGDRACVEAMLKRMDDDVELVQHAAIDALWKSTVPGDVTVTRTLMGATEHHPNWQVRKAAVEAIERIAVGGDKEVVDTLIGAMQDKEHSVREAAVKALEIVAPEGYELAINSVESKLQDEAWNVRRAAARTLTMLEPEGERQEAVTGKVYGVDDKNWYHNVQGYLMKPLFMPLR